MPYEKGCSGCFPSMCDSAENDTLTVNPKTGEDDADKAGKGQENGGVCET